MKRYFMRVPFTGWFVRVPRWLYNIIPWGGMVEMKESNDTKQT